MIDSSSKDLGTTYNLINNVIIPALDVDAEGRILIGLNQADMAMKGKHWDDGKNEPDDVLTHFLEQKVESVRGRIADATGALTSTPAFVASKNATVDMFAAGDTARQATIEDAVTAGHSYPKVKSRL